jgi:hypothetical protein
MCRPPKALALWTLALLTNVNPASFGKQAGEPARRLRAPPPRGIPHAAVTWRKLGR